VTNGGVHDLKKNLKIKSGVKIFFKFEMQKCRVEESSGIFEFIFEADLTLGRGLFYAALLRAFAPAAFGGGGVASEGGGGIGLAD